MVDAYSLVFAGSAVHRRRPRRPLRPQGRAAARPADLPGRFAPGRPPRHLRGRDHRGRAVMGFGAAFVMPSTLSVLANVFPPRRAHPGHRHLGRRVGRRRRPRPDRQRLPPRALLLGLGLLRQRPCHLPGADRRAHPHPEVERPRAGPARPGGCRAVDRRPGLARLRHHRGAPQRVGQPHHAGVVRRRRRVHRRVRVRGSCRSEHPMLDLHWFHDRASAWPRSGSCSSSSRCSGCSS